MRKLIISLLMGAMTLIGAAQKETNVNDLLFHCQIEGQEITLPCPWSEFERLGWSFCNPEDSIEVILPTYNTLLLDRRKIAVLSPKKCKVDMSFCNVSDKELTRKEVLVYGISYTPDDTPNIIYDFKLPSGIAAGISTEVEVIDTYGYPERSEQYDLETRLNYSDPLSEDDFFIVIANGEIGDISEGKVVGFGAMANKAVERLIYDANIAISDEQAIDIGNRRMYEYNIAGWTKELQLSATDSVRNNPIYISRIKYALGMNNYHLGDFNKAFEWMLQSAMEGDSEAEYSVAVMYSRGDGVEQDYHAAASWYEKSALQGQVEAMNNLGDYYCDGVGVEQSDAKAFQWWLKAAENGFSPVYVSLAECYRDGLLGLKRDYNQAFFWYEKATNSDDPIGIYNLSYMYYNGYGVKRDYRKAFEILLDADMDQYYVQQALGEHYYYGRGVEKDVSKAAIHFNDFLDLLDYEDAETRKALSKEMKAARKIIDKTEREDMKRSDNAKTI